MDYFEDYLLPEIFRYCSTSRDPWECFIHKVNLLPISMESKRRILRNFIDKRIGRNVFLAGYLAKYLFDCDYYEECDIRVPEVLPEDIVIQIFKVLREVRKNDFTL